MLRVLIFSLILLLSGCSAENFKQKPYTYLPEQTVEVSSPVTTHKAGQSDFSIPFYPHSTQTVGYRCVSTIPDGRTGYISRADFESMNTLDEIVEFYKRKKYFIEDFSVYGSRKIIVSDNPAMTVYPGKGKAASTVAFYRDQKRGRTVLVFTGFIPITK